MKTRPQPAGGNPVVRMTECRQEKCFTEMFTHRQKWKVIEIKINIYKLIDSVRSYKHVLCSTFAVHAMIDPIQTKIITKCDPKLTAPPDF